MICNQCSMDAGPVLFCPVCDLYLPSQDRGTKAKVSSRLAAQLLDGLAIILLFIVGFCTLGSIAIKFDVNFVVIAILVILSPLLYGIFFLALLAHGQTLGKWMMDLRVVDKRNGQNLGLGTMIVREFIGKWISGCFLGIGWFWAIFDRDTQAWHDKIVGSVVLYKRSHNKHRGVLFLAMTMICVGSIAWFVQTVRSVLVEAPQRKSADSMSQPPVATSPTNGFSQESNFDQTDKEHVYQVGGNIIAPSFTIKPYSPYTQEALENGLQGDVILSCVVDTDGDPQDIQVIKPLGMGLDENAVAALKQAHFRPAMNLDTGLPVAVRQNIALSFRIPQLNARRLRAPQQPPQFPVTE